MTLFNRAEELSDIKCENIFKKVLKKYFNDKEDNKTLAILEKQKLLKQNKNKDTENNIFQDSKEKILEQMNLKERITFLIVLLIILFFFFFKFIILNNY